GVVDAHRVVGGDRTVEKRPLRLAAILLAQLLKRLATVPELKDGPLLGGEIDLRFNLRKRHGMTSRKRRKGHCSGRTDSARMSAERKGRKTRGVKPRPRSAEPYRLALCRKPFVDA